MTMATAAPAASVQLQDVFRTYGEGHAAVHALRNVSVEIERGQFVVMLGPSGSGKTTLLNIVGGIDAATSGSVTAAGSDLTNLDQDGLNDYRRDNVAFIFQFYNLIPTLSARENVDLIHSLTGHNGSSDPLPAKQVLDDVGLGDRLDHFPSQMSGGEQQRVAIARALAKQPRLLLCDEPTGAVDLDIGRSILGLLREANERTGCTIVLVTHNSSIAKMADRVLRMRSGEIVDDVVNESPIDATDVTW